MLGSGLWVWQPSHGADVVAIAVWAPNCDGCAAHILPPSIHSTPAAQGIVMLLWPLAFRVGVPVLHHE